MTKYYNDIVSEWHTEWSMEIHRQEEQEHEDEDDSGTHFYSIVRFRRLTDVLHLLTVLLTSELLIGILLCVINYRSISHRHFSY